MLVINMTYNMKKLLRWPRFKIVRINYLNTNIKKIPGHHNLTNLPYPRDSVNGDNARDQISDPSQ